MLDWIEVPSGNVPPYACVVCRTTEGPMLDTHAEIPGYGRIYLCKNLCVRTGARVAGYAKGQRQNELLDAQKMADTFAAELDKSRASIASLESMNATQADRLGEQRDTIEYLEGRLAQVSAAAQEQAAHIVDVTRGAAA